MRRGNFRLGKIRFVSALDLSPDFLCLPMILVKNQLVAGHLWVFLVTSEKKRIFFSSPKSLARISCPSAESRYDAWSPSKRAPR